MKHILKDGQERLDIGHKICNGFPEGLPLRDVFQTTRALTVVNVWNDLLACIVTAPTANALKKSLKALFESLPSDY